MIRWVMFDAVDTVMYSEPRVAEVYARAAARHGSALSGAEVEERFRRAFAARKQAGGSTDDAALKTDEEREWEFWWELVEEVMPDVRDRRACFDELYEHFSRPESWRCFEEVGEVLGELRRSGYRLAVGSNFDARLHQVMDGLSDLGLVEQRVVSSEVGYRKPSRQFFAAAAKQFGCDASEVLMVGDDREADVRGAMAAGMRGVWLNRRGGEMSEKSGGWVRTLRELPGMLAGG